MEWAFLAPLPARNTVLVSCVGLDYFVLVFNGSDLLAVSGRDKDATWRTLGTLCRELDWSRPRLIYELQNGLQYRTVPPGHAIDWYDGEVLRTLDVAASTVKPILGVWADDFGLDSPTIGIEVLPPVDEVATLASAQWAAATTRRLRDEKKIPEGAVKADLARLLEAEATKAVKAGQITRALKATYLENQLTPWGIWPIT